MEEEVTLRLNVPSLWENDSWYPPLSDHPQIKAMGLFQEVEDPKLGKVHYQRPPWTFYGVPKVEPKPYRFADGH